MTDHKNFNGSYDTNPYIFKHFDVQNVTFCVNGTNYAHARYELDFTKKDIMPAFRDFLDCIGIRKTNASNGIDLSAYSNGHTFFALDSSGDSCNGLLVHNAETGNISLDMIFGTALSEPITVCVYVSYEKVITIKEKAGEDLFPKVEVLDNLEN